jgi:uncharacterized RDD family membrane protein YckC
MASEVVSLAGVSVCAQCKPAFIRRLQEGASAGQLQRVKYQGFWIRFAAKLLDGLLLSVVTTPLALVFLAPVFRRQAAAVAAAGGAPNPDPAAAFALLGAMGVFWSGYFLIVLAYNVWMNGRWGATVGKMAIGARIVNTDGSAIGYGKALGRFFAELLSMMTIYIGYIIAAFDSKKRALHDHICGTVVVAK